MSGMYFAHYIGMIQWQHQAIYLLKGIKRLYFNRIHRSYMVTVPSYCDKIHGNCAEGQQIHLSPLMKN